MELKYLQSFMQVIETGSFSKAAAKLGYTQSTISFQIKQLEEELNCQLFDRVGKRIKLTDKGEILKEHAKCIDNDFSTLIQDFREEGISKGIVHIFSSDSICEKMVLLNYHDFYEKYPGIKLVFSTGATVDLLKVLDKNEADVIFTLDSHIFNSNYIIARESPVKMHFVTNKNHPLTAKRNLSIQDLLSYPFLLTEKGMSYRKLLDSALAEMSIVLEPVLETGRTDIIMECLSKGDAIGFLPDFVIESYKDVSKVARLDVSDINITIWKQLIYHKDKWISKPLYDFIEYVKAHEFEW